SARRLTVCGPVMIQSGAKWPSPSPSTGSLLVTIVMAQVGLPPQLSVAVAVTTTGIILWFGGQRTSGDAVTLVMTGPSTSLTVTLNVQPAVALAPSVAVQLTLVVP